MTPDEVIAATSGPIGNIGAAFYFHPATLATGKAAGLAGFRWYVLGRGGVMGDVEAAVITSAFGYFSPNLTQKLWSSAKEKMAPREAGRRYHLCAAERGRELFANVAGLDAFNAAAEKVVAAADRDGLPLFAGIAAEPLVDDAPGRAMQLAAVLREFRGSSHLVAILASGLRAREAHFAKRPNDVKTFGYDESEVTPVTDDHHAKLAAAESLTNKLVRSAYVGLSDAEAQALVAGAIAMEAALKPAA
jgi:hypothetical protein